MAWNEPGNNGDKDPWGNRNNDGPPDIDEVLKNLRRKFNGFFGGSGSSDSNGGGENPIALGLIAAVVFVIWLLSGTYTQDEAERGVVLRFGEYTRTTMPGLNWHLPYPIERVEMVNVNESRTENIGFRTLGGPKSLIPSESLMLTQDENIIEIQVEIQYRVDDPAAFLFNVENPSQTLRQMTESTVREVVGKTNMDDVFKFARGEMAVKTRTLLQQLLDDYGTGLIVTSFNFPDIQAPGQVREAFADVIKAGADKERMKNEAEAYANDVVPKARGAAFRLVQEAEAYKSQVLSKAQGETSRFLQVMKEYEKAPDITRERLYLDAMESVYNRTSKVLVDVSKGSNNLLYLPLDKMQGNASSTPRAPLDLNPITTYPSSTNSRSSSDTSSVTDSRSRRER